MDGQTVHTWACGGQPVKMLPGGSLLGSKRERLSKSNPLVAEPSRPENAPLSDSPRRRRGGWHDAIEFIQESWDGKEEWSFCNWDDDRTGVMMSRQHHDFQREGNPVGYYAPGQEFVEKGKTLILAHKNKLVPEISEKELEDDVVYEIDWNGNLTGFEWHGTDHFHEFGFDEFTREAIYRGENYDEERGFSDWLHVNSMSALGKNHWYDETGDERFNPANIIISPRHADTAAICSRATGNIVWKVGPDFSEGTPEHNLGQFIGQHHAHMIPRGLPGEGNILVFDNGRESVLGDSDIPRRDMEIRDYSRVIEFNPVTLEIVWQYGAESGEERFYSHNVSGAQRLPNGNTLITDGPNGRLFEVTPNNEKVWEFIVPPAGTSVYRAYRIPPDWVPGNPSGYAEWATLYE